MRSVEFSFGLVLSRLEHRYPRRLFEDHTAIYRLCGHYLFDFALSYYRISFFTDSALVQKIDDIFKSRGLLVYVILALSAAEKFARYDHFVVIHRKDLVAVVEEQRYFTVRKRLSALRSRENNVLHGATAKSLCRLFAQHPTYRVGYVAFAASVRSDYRRYPVPELYFGSVRERFESVKFNFFKIHFSTALIFLNF